MDVRRAAAGLRDPAAAVMSGRCQAVGVTLPVRCGTEVQAARSNPPAVPAEAIRTDTVDGSSTGLKKSTDQSNASPRAAPTPARASDAVYMPWAIARGNPNALAVNEDRWIGLWSPETAAYR